MTRRASSGPLTLLLFLLPLAAAATPRIALIIDDLGYQFACAVLPATPRGRELAALAADNGKEVLLHLPLQPQEGGLGDPGLLRLDMSRGQFSEAFVANLADVPFATGVNNHRGSLLTRHPGHMGWLMEELRAHGGLFFVDSYTTRHSVALALAEEAGVPALRRDVFLDNERRPEAIARAFERLKRRARANGTAVGIGHPYPETLEFLEQALPALGDEGIELVPLRALFPPPGLAGDD